MHSRVILALLVLFIAFNNAQQFTANCGFTYNNGSYVSVTSLAGYYFFNNTAPSNATPAMYLPQGNITMEIQLCGAISSSQFSSCTNNNSAVNIIDASGNCYSGGNAAVAGWELNPSGNGVGLVYYGGSSVNNIVEYSTRVYFECSSNAVGLSYEFLSLTSSQYHLIVYTPAVCASNAVTPPTPVNTVVNCVTNIYGNKSIDVSVFKSANGSYLFANVGGASSNIFIELQICDNVQTNFPGICTIPSPANMINGSTCTPLGDITTYEFGVNPSNAGIHLTFYHGALVGRVGTLSTRIYFQCPALEQEIPPNIMIYEHYSTVAYQHHFAIANDTICPANLPTTPPTNPPVSTTSTTSPATGITSTTSPAVSTSTSSGAVVLAPSVIFAALLYFIMHM